MSNSEQDRIFAKKNILKYVVLVIFLPVFVYASNWSGKPRLFQVVQDYHDI